MPAKEKSASPAREEEKESPSVSTRGVPADETMFLPAHDSPLIRSFEDKNENLTRNLWGLEEIVTFVFPKKYQPVYHQIATDFLTLLVQKTKLVK